MYHTDDLTQTPKLSFQLSKKDHILTYVLTPSNISKEITNRKRNANLPVAQLSGRKQRKKRKLRLMLIAC